VNGFCPKVDTIDYDVCDDGKISDFGEYRTLWEYPTIKRT
jgi:hypothetical protein